MFVHPLPFRLSPSLSKFPFSRETRSKFIHALSRSHFSADFPTSWRSFAGSGLRNKPRLSTCRRGSTKKRSGRALRQYGFRLVPGKYRKSKCPPWGPVCSCVRSVRFVLGVCVCVLTARAARNHRVNWRAGRGPDSPRNSGLKGKGGRLDHLGWVCEIAKCCGFWGTSPDIDDQSGGEEDMKRATPSEK